MRLAAVTLSGLLSLSSAAMAQEADKPAETTNLASGTGMKSLLATGYEIKAAVPNGARYIVFLQKDQSAYACEFVTLTNSRCGSIN